jgi:hypothetical protein
MFKKLLFAVFLTIAIFGVPVLAQKTVVSSAKAKTMLLGRHKLSLQWISWDYFGAATVTNRGGALYLKGEQKQRGGTDFVRINGKITEISAKEFKFDGTIITQVSHINGGQPCTREGAMTFRITGTRKYWRLLEMDNPCEGVTDYVDIFFR